MLVGAAWIARGIDRGIAAVQLVRGAVPVHERDRWVAAHREEQACDVGRVEDLLADADAEVADLHGDRAHERAGAAVDRACAKQEAIVDRIRGAVIGAAHGGFLPRRRRDDGVEGGEIVELHRARPVAQVGVGVQHDQAVLRRGYRRRRTGSRGRNAAARPDPRRRCRPRSARREAPAWRAADGTCEGLDGVSCAGVVHRFGQLGVHGVFAARGGGQSSSAAARPAWRRAWGTKPGDTDTKRRPCVQALTKRASDRGALVARSRGSASRRTATDGRAAGA